MTSKNLATLTVGDWVPGLVRVPDSIFGHALAPGRLVVTAVLSDGHYLVRHPDGFTETLTDTE